MEEDINSCIIDSSFILAHLLPDETSKDVREFFNRLKVEPITLVAPLIFPFEVFNGIQTAIMRRRITVHLAKKLQQQFLKIAIRLEAVNLIDVSSIAQKHLLTIYDASYLYLAENINASLLTLDGKLKKLTSRRN